jgi:hypothetical protein
LRGPVSAAAEQLAGSAGHQAHVREPLAQDDEGLCARRRNANVLGRAVSVAGGAAGDAKRSRPHGQRRAGQRRERDARQPQRCAANDGRAHRVARKGEAAAQDCPGGGLGHRRPVLHGGHAGCRPAAGKAAGAGDRPDRRRLQRHGADVQTERILVGRRRRGRRRPLLLRRAQLPRLAVLHAAVLHVHGEAADHQRQRDAQRPGGQARRERRRRGRRPPQQPLQHLQPRGVRRRRRRRRLWPNRKVALQQLGAQAAQRDAHRGVTGVTAAAAAAAAAAVPLHAQAGQLQAGDAAEQRGQQVAVGRQAHALHAQAARAEGDSRRRRARRLRQPPQRATHGASQRPLEGDDRQARVPEERHGDD